MKMQGTVWTLLVLTLAGCSVHNPFTPTTQEKVEQANFTRHTLDAQVEQQARRLVTGVKEVLERKPAPRTAEEQVSLDLTVQAERMLGGEPIEKLDVATWLDKYRQTNHRAYGKLLQEQAALVTELRNLKLNNAVEIGALEEQLERERTDRRGLWSSIKQLGIGMFLLLVLVTILLLLFAPHVLGWLVAKLPGLIRIVGVTSVRVVDALVKGVQKAREQIANMPDDVQLNKFEILKMIDSGLKEEADPETTNTVEAIRKTFNLQSISKRLGRRD